MLLDPGRYRLVGRVQTSGRKGFGASLWPFKMYTGANRIVANGAWNSLERPFVVSSGEEEVEFICDLQGDNAEARFDLESLQLVRQE